MNKFKYLLALSLILSACAREAVPQNGTSPSVPPPESSVDGTINGGGGIGIRCNGRLQMLDIFEAQQQGLTIITSPNSQAAIIDLVANTFAKHYWNIETIPVDKSAKVAADTYLTPIFNGQPFKNLETGKLESVHFVRSLPLSNDIGKYTLPTGCHLEQIAYYSDSKTELSIVKSAWDELDWLSKGVLATHELVYLVDRREGLENLRNPHASHTSESTRRFVGRLFTLESLPEKSNAMPASDMIYKCDSSYSADSTYAYAFNRISDSKLSIVFNQILGDSSPYQMRADFSVGLVESLMDIAAGEIDTQATLILTGDPTATDFVVEIHKTKGAAAVFTLIDVQSGKKRVIKHSQDLTCEKYH